VAVKLIVGSDHAGIELRGEAARAAAEAGFEVEDVAVRVQKIHDLER